MLVVKQHGLQQRVILAVRMHSFFVLILSIMSNGGSLFYSRAIIIVRISALSLLTLSGWYRQSVSRWSWYTSQSVQTLRRDVMECRRMWRRSAVCLYESQQLRRLDQRPIEKRTCISSTMRWSCPNDVVKHCMRSIWFMRDCKVV